MKKKSIFIIVIILILIVVFFIAQKQRRMKYNYDVYKIEEYNFFVYKDKDKFGVIDKTGKIIVNAKFTSVIIPNPEKAVFICYNDENLQVLNEKEETLFKQYDVVEPIKLKNVASAQCYEKSILMYKKEGLFGLIDLNGKEITKNIYNKIENIPPTEGKFLVRKGDKYGVIDLKGNTLVNAEYYNIISDGYYTNKFEYTKSGFITLVKTKDGIKYGYISYEGKQILPNKYNEINRISKEDNKNIYLIASENGKFRII